MYESLANVVKVLYKNKKIWTNMVDILHTKREGYFHDEALPCRISSKQHDRGAY